MIIETTRFGPVQVNQPRLLHFPDGLVGFPAHKRFALIETTPRSGFYWLQSADEPGLAFAVTDHRRFVPEYSVTLRAEDGLRLGAGADDRLQLLVIASKIGTLLTGNLQGPIVINPANLTAVQLVLSEKRYPTRHPLMSVPAREPALSRSA